MTVKLLGAVLSVLEKNFSKKKSYTITRYVGVVLPFEKEIAKIYGKKLTLTTILDTMLRRKTKLKWKCRVLPPDIKNPYYLIHIERVPQLVDEKLAVISQF